MTERPDIADCPDAATFRQWYYLRSELAAFARANGLRTSGGKFQIADDIAHFLETGQAPPRKVRPKPASTFDWHTAPLTDDTVITDNYRNTQNMRRYMQSHIPGFKFSIPMMDWIKANTGKTLADAVAQAKLIATEKAAGKKQPDQPHNQYNAYTRAYFAAVPDGTGEEVRKLWTARRQRPGPYVFHRDDLALIREK